MNVIRAAVTGDYQPIGNPAEADCVIGQSFGASESGPGEVNELLAEFILDHINPNLPLLLQHEIASALPSTAPIPALTIEGDASTALGTQLDSWEVLEQAHEYMNGHNLKRPLVVAQAFHVGRVSLQAIKQGMDPIVPANLPREFAPNSTQPWTRNAGLWVPRELVGMVYLKAKHKL